MSGISWSSGGVKIAGASRACAETCVTTTASSLSTKLFEHQEVGLRFLLDRFCGAGGLRGGLLGDAPGMGKTRMAIALIDRLFELNLACRVLVVAPASLTRTWVGEFKTHAPDLVVELVDGDSQIKNATHTLERLAETVVRRVFETRRRRSRRQRRRRRRTRQVENHERKKV